MPDLLQAASTRSTSQPTHLLHTPDSFVRTPLPGITGGNAIVHAAPRLGAAFLWYTLELDPAGTLAPNTTPGIERTLYVLEGTGRFSGSDLEATPGACLYNPAAVLTATTPLRAAVLETRHQPLTPGTPAPAPFRIHEDAVAPEPLNGDPDVLVRALIPPGPAFDFALNTMTYAPGAALAQVEVHHIEHGLLMLEGGGIYRLGESWYPVAAGDFIWMAPFCPQWFAAIGKVPAKYLIYKDFNRVPSL